MKVLIRALPESGGWGSARFLAILGFFHSFDTQIKQVGLFLQPLMASPKKIFPKITKKKKSFVKPLGEGGVTVLRNFFVK